MLIFRLTFTYLKYTHCALLNLRKIISGLLPLWFCQWFFSPAMEKWIKRQVKKIENKYSAQSPSIRINDSAPYAEKNKSDTAGVLLKTVELKTRKKKQILFSRYVEFPGDGRFNGAALVYQLDLDPNVLKEQPDYLNELGKQHYKHCERAFPVSISDNF